MLHSNLNLPFWLCRRIVAYRNKLGGYFSKAQLKEVYGFKSYYYTKVAPFVMVDTLQIQKICINSVGFKQLLKHPYCDYNLTKKIFQARDKVGGTFADKKQLLKVINTDTNGLKLMHYLYICRSDLRDD
jgi:DNA uptake protein ComE-like DNA-binding protein